MGQQALFSQDTPGSRAVGLDYFWLGPDRAPNGPSGGGAMVQRHLLIALKDHGSPRAAVLTATPTTSLTESGLPAMNGGLR